MDKVYVIGRDSVPEVFRARGGEPLRLSFVCLPGISAKVAVRVDIDEPGCEVDLTGLYLCGSDDKIEFNIRLNHNVGGSVSRQNFRGIVGGKSSALFDGLIYVAPDAQKTKAYQENRTILLDDTARVESRPQLEIYADDVECSHGCTSGFLNEEEAFYMRSRGIPEETAQYLQKIAFISPVVERLPEDLAAEVYAGIH